MSLRRLKSMFMLTASERAIGAFLDGEETIEAMWRLSLLRSQGRL